MAEENEGKICLVRSESDLLIDFYSKESEALLEIINDPLTKTWAILKGIIKGTQRDEYYVIKLYKNGRRAE